MSKNTNISKNYDLPAPKGFSFSKNFSFGNEVSFGKNPKDNYRGASVSIMNNKNEIVSAGGLVHNKGTNVKSGNNNRPKKLNNHDKVPVHTVISLQQKSVLFNNKGKCTKWDGVSPLNTYSSTTYSPEDMSDVIEEILKKFLNENVDYEKISTYLFIGKKFSFTGDSDFEINIFSPGVMSNPETTCEVEIRKMSGNSFCFAGLENQIVQHLLKQNAITKYQGSELGIIIDTMDSFQSEPLPVNMDEDSSSEYTSDSENVSEMTTKLAQKLISDAVDPTSYRDDLRHSVQHLREILGDKKNIQVFRNISSGAIKQIMTFIEQSYDSWMIKSLLESINILLSNKCKPSQGLANGLIKLQQKWSKPVVFKIDNSEFKFPASHQIRKLCDNTLIKL